MFSCIAQTHYHKNYGETKMKKHTCMLLAGFIIIMTSFSTQAFMIDANINTDIKVTSAHIWRGVVVNDEPCIQPSFTFVGPSWAFNVWGTWDLTKVEDASGHTRVDTMLDYAWTGKKQVLRPGVVAYIYQDDSARQADDTFEVFIEYALDITALPSLTLYYDFGELNAFYVTFSSTHSINFTKKLSLDLCASVSAAEEKYNDIAFAFPENTEKGSPAYDPKEGTFVDLTLQALMPITVGENDRCEIIPSVKYMALLDSDIKDAVKNADQKVDEFVYSLTLSFAF